MDYVIPGTPTEFALTPDSRLNSVTVSTLDSTGVFMVSSKVIDGASFMDAPYGGFPALWGIKSYPSNVYAFGLIQTSFGPDQQRCERGWDAPDIFPINATLRNDYFAESFPEHYFFDFICYAGSIQLPHLTINGVNSDTDPIGLLFPCPTQEVHFDIPDVDFTGGSALLSLGTQTGDGGVFPTTDDTWGFGWAITDLDDNLIVTQEGLYFSQNANDPRFEGMTTIPGGGGQFIPIDYIIAARGTTWKVKINQQAGSPVDVQLPTLYLSSVDRGGIFAPAGIFKQSISHAAISRTKSLLW
jgi:hypothetical protein